MFNKTICVIALLLILTIPLRTKAETKTFESFTITPSILTVTAGETASVMTTLIFVEDQETWYSTIPELPSEVEYIGWDNGATRQDRKRIDHLKFLVKPKTLDCVFNIKITVSDIKTNLQETIESSFTLIVKSNPKALPAKLELNYPRFTTKPNVTIFGNTDAEKLSISNYNVPIIDNKFVFKEVSLKEGSNQLTAIATNFFGEETIKEINIMFYTIPPSYDNGIN